ALEASSSFTLEAVLSSIHCFRCHNHTELTALAHLLPDFLQRHPGVRLVVVDSVAFPFRHGFDDLSLRTRLLSGLAQQLIALACTHHLAVVLTNQMTTRVSGQGESVLVPALGESWGHAATHRLVLRWEGRTRVATVFKSPSHREDSACFAVTPDGVRDVPQPPASTTVAQASVHHHSVHRHSLESNPRKRRRGDEETTPPEGSTPPLTPLARRC
ncbi:DNA repair protein RAD51 homolog 3-like, partial [Lampetra fluviatilis]